MPGKNWLDVYMDYKLSGCEDEERTCGHTGCLPCVLGILAAFWILMNLFD